MKTVLFDMDGTLTEPRKNMLTETCNALSKLQKNGFVVGIVSGSDLDYIIEQCELILDIPGLDYDMLDIYPCNGTKHYKIGDYGNPVKQYELVMKDFLIKGRYQKLVYELSHILAELSVNPDLLGIMPLTGNFINMRGSMINFCPIGRNASQKDRKVWCGLDRKFEIRQFILERLNAVFSQGDITFKLGGDTSIDIFPKGWDKTFVLQNFKDEDDLWFVGDRCQKLGNDKELYDAIKLRSSGESFETGSPSKTIEIINNIIHQHSG
jgi:phosphomannomutase